MNEGLIWWLAVEVIGAVAFPVAFVFFRFLPDRGYAFSKALGLLLMTYVLWLGATAHVIPNARWSIVLILVAMAAASAALAWRVRSEMAGFVRDRWRYLLLVEGLFTVAFSLAVLFRSYVPNIDSTQEAFVDFADINAILRSGYFPPNDPFLSGHSIPVYYFGHLVVATLTKLTGVDSEVSYNLALGMFLSLAGVAAFGLVHGLVAAAAKPRAAIAAGLAAMLFLAVMGNVEGLLELLAAHGVGSKSFYELLDIYGLDGPRTSSKWYPTEFYWYGRAIIIAGPAGDRDFPFHSFLEGYLHGHSMGIPFFLAGLAVALNLWRWPDLLASPIDRQKLLVAAGTGVVIGAAAFVNLIDLPTLAAVVIAVLATRAWAEERRISREPLSRAALLAAVVVAGALLLFLPYYASFEPEGSLRPMEAARQQALGQALELNITFPHHLLYTWLPFFWLTLGLAAAVLTRGRLRRGMLGLAVAPPVLGLLAWVVSVLVGDGGQAFSDDLGTRDWNWLTLALLGSFLAIVLLALMAWLGREDVEDRRGSLSFVLVLAGVTMLMLFGIELFWIKVLPRADDRFWTALHINYQAWFLFSLIGAYSLHYLLTTWRPLGLPLRALGAAWLAVLVLVLAAAFVYPVIAPPGRAGGFAGPRSLSVLEAVKRFAPGEYEAISWIRSSVKGDPVILEAVGDSYSPFGRVAVYTGLPTLLAWPSWHETQWRHSTDFVAPRTQAAETTYKTRDPAEARALLDEYDVEYVYVGPLERQQYGQVETDKFAAFMDVAFENGEVTIYRVRE